MTAYPNHFHTPDLTQHAPRSARTQLGGYALLPRILDKCRASLADQIGEYCTNCPIDQEFLSFTGIDYTALREQLAAGRSDTEILRWVGENAKHPRTPWEIEAWTAYQNRRQPDRHTKAFAFFTGLLQSIAPERTDIASWIDLLDLDDYHTFGGQV